jgi:hypothetical protein
MVAALGYLLRVSTATKTRPARARRNQRRATGMAARTRDLHRVKTAATPAEKLAPKRAETVARIVAAGGDPNAPRDADALATIASRAFARVLSEMTGEAWVAA